MGDRHSGTTEATMRLDRMLSQCSGLSRSQVKKLLQQDCVEIDQTCVREPGLLVTPGQRITLQGRPVEWPREYYVMLHKPAGHVCSQADADHPLVTDLLDRPWAARLHSAGRLDVDTTGLVLLTSDGRWSHALTSPRRACEKRYLVRVKHPLDPMLPARFAEGLQLHGDSKPTLPARLELLDAYNARIFLREGRYHQVKRMFAACGNRVEALHREQIGIIVLDPALAPGQWRELHAHEVAMVQA